MTLSRVSRAALLSGAVVLAGCEGDELMRPRVPAYTGAAMFYRYVALGNSITAGFQSGGISLATQGTAYPVIVAGQMGGSAFHIPALAVPGCPVPYSNIFTQTKVIDIPGDCAFRMPDPPPYLSNVAVPGAAVLDLLHNLPDPGARSNELTMLLLGGRTQIDAMMETRPTFVSVWIGNNDVLAAAISNGDTTLITPTPVFEAAYAEALDAIEAADADAILIGVGNVTGIPYFSRGSTYYGLYLSGALPDSLTVTANCAPPRGDSVLVGFPFGGTLLAQAQADVPTTLDCTEPPTVQPAEFAKIVNAVTQFNAFISSEAAARGFAYYDPNPTFDALRTVPTQVAPFPAFGADCSTNPFGTAFSCDGVYPSTATHRLIARELVTAINAEFGAAIPAVP